MINDQIKIEKDLSEPNWLKRFKTWWPEFRRGVPNGDFSIGEDGMDYSGEPVDEGAAEKTQTLLAGLFDKGFKLNNQSKMPVKKSPHLRVVRDKATITLSGEVPTDAHRKAIEAAGGESGTQGENKQSAASREEYLGTKLAEGVFGLVAQADGDGQRSGCFDFRSGGGTYGD